MSARPGRTLAWLAGIVFVLAGAVYVAFQVSPWPRALLIRYGFEKTAARTSLALARHVPAGVVSQLDLRYDAGDPDARLDVFSPPAREDGAPALPTVVWIHGGGWISGSKDEIANYARVLAGRGYTVVGVDYSIAPERTYPTPVRQANAALGYLVRNAARLRVDPRRFVLAGDSGGAHIAAQLANAVSDSSYAQALGVTPSIGRAQLAGMLLLCGAYDVRRVNLEGSFGNFLRTVLWSYSGTRDFVHDRAFDTASVIDYVTPAFPPAFVSAGNADPLESQSRAFARALAAQGVPVDTLFYPAAHVPALGHEYQFDLDSADGRACLERSVAFLAEWTAPGRP